MSKLGEGVESAGVQGAEGAGGRGRRGAGCRGQGAGGQGAGGAAFVVRHGAQLAECRLVCGARGVRSQARGVVCGVPFGARCARRL